MEEPSSPLASFREGLGTSFAALQSITDYYLKRTPSSIVAVQFQEQRHLSWRPGHSRTVIEVITVAVRLARYRRMLISP